MLTATIQEQGVVLSSDALASDHIACGQLLVALYIFLPVENAYYVISLEEYVDLPKIAAF